MAVTLLFRSLPVQIGNLVLDGSLSENHARSADVTDHEVEDGANVTDHVRIKPAQVTIEGIMTNTPLDRSAVADYRQAGPLIASALFTDTSLEDAPTETPGRAENAFSLLETLFESRLPFTVITNLKTYKSMIIESLQVPRDARTGDAVRVTVGLKQIRTVTNKLVTVSTAVPGAKKKQSLGDKAGTDKPKEEYQSAFSRLTGIGEHGEGLQ